MDTPASFSWICRNQAERERLIAMHRLLVPANGRIAVVAVIGFAVCAPTLPMLTVALLLSSFGLLAVIGQSLSRWRRPEVVMLCTVAFIETTDAAAVAIAHLERLGALTLLLWPLIGFNARYPRRVAVAGTVFTVLLVTVTELAVGAAAVVRDPLGLTIPLVVVVAVAVVTSATRESDIAHARQAVLDPLTGLLNRAALARRIDELTRQAPTAHMGVCVLLGDIDRFKQINDAFGHQAGDDVLRAVASRLRAELRAFDLLYRIGGEEFVVLAPGATRLEGHELAERLRAAIAAEPLAGLPVTMSWGVSASESEFDWDRLYRSADRALYDAKAGGRDQVVSMASGDAVAA